MSISDSVAPSHLNTGLPTTLNQTPDHRCPTIFRSFWMGGYESATHRTTSGERLDMIAGVQHDLQVEHDYQILKSVGMRTCRDALRWHLIDRGGNYDFSSFEPMLQASLRQGVQVIWDLCHYGWPEDVDLLKPEFPERFARFTAAVARFIREHTDEVQFYTPMNEISFLSWAASRDFVFPFAFDRDNDVKMQLLRATIAACEAVRGVDPRSRFSYPEPTIHVLPPRNRPDLADRARQYRDSQFEAWDAVAGLQHPELGGRPEFLDIVGSNFYHSNQWEVEGNGRLRWEDEPRDERWLPYRELLKEIWERYRRPLYVAETSHFGTGRARWIKEIGEEVSAAIQSGVPVQGICLYPIIDRYDWQDKNHWHNSGLWDFRRTENGTLERVANPEYLEQLSETQKFLAKLGCR